MNARPARQPWYVGLLALAAAVVIAAILYMAVNVFFFVALLAAPPKDDLQPPFTLARTETAAEPTAAPRPTAAPESIFTGPTQSPTDDTWVPFTTYGMPVGDVHRKWVAAMKAKDLGAAVVLYRAAEGGDPIIEVSEHVALVYSAQHRPDPDPLKIGALRDMRVVGDYAAPGETGVRYGIGEMIFDGGRLCLQTTLSDEGGAGWYVRAWGTITADACRAAMERIAAGDGGQGQEHQP